MKGKIITSKGIHSGDEKVSYDELRIESPVYRTTSSSPRAVPPSNSEEMDIQVRTWLSRISNTDTRARALLNYENRPSSLRDRTLRSLSEAIGEAFHWASQPEGNDYWDHVASHITDALPYIDWLQNNGRTPRPLSLINNVTSTELENASNIEIVLHLNTTIRSNLDMPISSIGIENTSEGETFIGGEDTPEREEYFRIGDPSEASNINIIEDRGDYPTEDNEV